MDSKDKNDDLNQHGTMGSMDAIYVGLVFLDAVAVGGKGFIMFAVFGLEFEIVIKPLVIWVKTVKSLYSVPPTQREDDPRLYHWTLRYAAKIFDFTKKL